MKTSMWSSYIIEMSPEEMVTTMVAGGWDCTELSDEHAKVLLDRGDAVKEGNKFKKFCGDYGFSLPQGHFYLTLNIAHPDKNIRVKLLDDFKAWCDLFACLDIRAGVLHPGGAGYPEGTDPQYIKDIIRESMAVIDSYVAGTPVTVCLENMAAPRIGQDVDDLLELIEPFSPDNWGICLDTGHLNLAGKNFAQFIHKAGPALKALHIADNLGVNDDHLLPYSKGQVPWDEVMAALKDINYQGLFNFEVPGERCPLPISLDKLEYARKLALWMTRDLA